MPVEPRGRDRSADGPDARLRERRELGELAEAVRAPAPGHLGLDRRELGLARRDRVVGEHVDRHERDRGGEQPRAARTPGAPCRSTDLRRRPRASAGIRLTALMPGSPRRSGRRRPRDGRRRRRRTRRAGPRGRRRPRAAARPPRRAARRSRGSPTAGPVSTTRSTTAAPSCIAWKSSELRTSSAIRRTPSFSTSRASATMSASPSTSSTGVQQADVAEPAVGVLERQAAALGELAGDRLGAVAGDAREHAGRARPRRRGWSGRRR